MSVGRVGSETWSAFASCLSIETDADVRTSCRLSDSSDVIAVMATDTRICAVSRRSLAFAVQRTDIALSDSEVCNPEAAPPLLKRFALRGGNGRCGSLIWQRSETSRCSSIASPRRLTALSHRASARTGRHGHCLPRRRPGLGFGYGFQTVDRYGANGLASVGTQTSATSVPAGNFISTCWSHRGWHAESGFQRFLSRR